MTFFYDLNKKLSDLADKQTLTEGKKPDFLDLDKDGDKKEPMKKAVADKKKNPFAKKSDEELDEGIYQGGPDKSQIPAVNRLGNKLTTADLEKERTQSPTSAEGMRALQDKLSKIHPMDNMEEAAKWRDPKYKDKLYTQEPRDYDQYDYGDDDYYNPKPDNYPGEKKLKGGGEFDHNDPLQKGQGIGRSGIKHSILDRGPRKGLPSRNQITSLKGSIKDAHGTHAEPNLPEAGTPMTPKQKSFAALAPPTDKITFADKIAGAKKEVDEMLGDVAAKAMKRAVGHRDEMEEGWDDMVKDVRARAGQAKPGDVTHGAKHDIKHTATGRIVTRRTDPNTGHSVGAEDDGPADGEKRGRGRPKGKGAGKSIGAKVNSGKSKLMTREGPDDLEDQGEYDQEGNMAKDDIKTIVRHAQALSKVLGDNDNLPEWVQSKLAKIEGMMISIDEYMQNQEGDVEVIDEKDLGKHNNATTGFKALAKKTGGGEKGNRIAGAQLAKMRAKGQVEEESDDEEDSKAERAGKKVAKDIEHDEGHTGKDDNRAEKAGKKVTKDIEYDDKKDKKEKKEEVDETTTSGSVAPASGGKASGSMQFGKGVYESLNNRVEAMLSESLSVNANMDTEGHNSLTVTASDEDALKLAELLKMAGLGGDTYKEACPSCGSTDCGCDQVEEGDYSNSPDLEFGSTDSMVNTLSGGLNGRKSTGQTVNAPVNRDPARQISMVENTETTLWNLYKQYDKK